MAAPTTAEIKKLYAGLKASDPSLTPAQLVQGVRTLVHEALKAESPPPYPLPEPAKGKTREDFTKALFTATPEVARQLHEDAFRDLAERKTLMHASVPIDVQMEFQRNRPVGIRDAHHYAQMLHGKGLWEHGDALVAAALDGKVS
jgi:hypothetical protein